jgi:HSP20 family protein
MADLTRWEPLRDLVSLREAMDRLFEESFVRVPGLRKGGEFFSPEVDMYETDKEVVVKATVPGVKPEDMEITVSGDRLVLKGKLEEEKSEEGATYVIKERRFGEFERVMPLPATADVDKAEAEFKDGVLTVKIPKKPEAPSKKIQIKGGGK